MVSPIEKISRLVGKALSRRGRAAQSAAAPSLAKSKRRKLPGFKGFGRSASTTQLVSLGGIPSSSSSAGDATERDSHEEQEEDWRIEPVPPVAAAAPAEPPPAEAVKSSISSRRLSSLAVAKCWYGEFSFFS